jgi:hypothetical protein
MPKGVYIHEKGRVITWGNKISEAMKGKKHSEEHNLHSSLSHKGLPSGNKGKRGYKHTDEALQKIRISSEGNQYCLGYKHSEETRKKQSEAAKKRNPPSMETREKIRQARLGVPRPELRGENNPMHTHINSYKSKFGKTGFRKDLGIFVRSTWEANMMRIYKYLGLTVEYEPKSFKLSDGRTYRPDFFIKDTKQWIEVKGHWFGDAYERFIMFKQEYPNICIQVIDLRRYKRYITKFSNKIEMEV